eukprot:UN11917
MILMSLRNLFWIRLNFKNYFWMFLNTFYIVIGIPEIFEKFLDKYDH